MLNPPGLSGEPLIVLDYSWHKGITFSGKFKIFPPNLSGEPKRESRKKKKGI